MRAAPSNRLLRSVVATAVLLAGLAAVFVGLPQVAVSAGTGVAVPAVLANPLSSTPVVQANGWIIGTPPADGYGVILHTTNDGQLWVRQGSTSDVPDVELNNVKAVDSDTAWVVGNADSGYGVVLRTSDAGLTWVRQGGPGTIPDESIFGVGPVDRETAWVVGENGTILRTDDGGQTWTQQASGTTADLYEVAAIDAQIAWVVGDIDNGYGVILHTTNGGQTWERQGSAATIGDRGFIDLTAVDAQTAWAVGGHGLLVKTTDGGDSWQSQMAYGLSDNNGACAVDGNTAWVASDYGAMHRTTDGGAVWNEQAPTLPGGFYLLGVSGLGPNTAWVVGGGTVFPAGGIILHTTDAGTTWQIQSTPVDVTLRRVSFVEPPCTITPSVASGHGTISPASAQTVPYGATPTFSFTPDVGYHVSGVSLDGTPVSMTAANAYTLPTVTDDHTLSVSFAPPPVTTVEGVPAGWVRHALTLHFSAAAAAGSAPIAYSEYRLGSGAWTHGARVTIRRQGVTTVAYRSADTEGNVETTQSCTVRIDGVPPTVVDIGSVVAWHGGTAHFAYRLSDPAVTSLRARLVITRYGRRVACVNLGRRPTGRKLAAALHCVWPTSQYQWRVIATDPTGQRTVGAAHTLRVLPNRNRH
jgi:photosystem II stability/assembly factor-like uncharacterized protein